MSFAALKAASRTLRFRLMAWNTAVVLLAGLLTLLGVRGGVRRALLREVDELLLEDTQEIRLALQGAEPNFPRLYEELERKARGHERHHWFVQFRDAAGAVTWASPNAPAADLDALPYSDVKGTNTVLSSVADYRVAETRFERPALALRVGTSLASLREDVALLTRVLIGAGGCLLVAAPLGGYWLAGRATRPLGRIISTAARLRPSRLDERLPVRGTGDELEQLAQTVNGLLDRIASYIAQKHDFLANAAHELRSPLTAIRASVEVALGSKPLPPEHAGSLGDVLEECDRLGRLVNQLLLLAEGDAGRLGLTAEPCRLDRVVGKAVEMFRGVAEARGVELRHPPPPPMWVRGEESHLRQVVNNLIDNAVKFTPAGGRVLVEARADRVAGEAALRVADTGEGIPEEDISFIFDRFYRVDKSRHRGEGGVGTGLGLSICRTIVSALGGNVTARSAAGRGSEFLVTLPLCPEGPGGGCREA